MEKTCVNVQPALQDDERLDEIGFGGLQLWQRPVEFCYGVDAVLLADFASRLARKESQTAVDLGCGTGVIPLILSARTEMKNLWGVEIQEGACALAQRNSRLNGLEDRLRFICGNVREVQSWGKALLNKADVITCNPPYTAGGGGMTSENQAKMIARHELTAGLSDFLTCGAALLREKGDFFLVHRPSRLVDICCLGREAGLELKTLQLISPNAQSAPNIVLAHLVKGGGRELKVLPALQVRDEQGDYTEALKAVYR